MKDEMYSHKGEKEFCELASKKINNIFFEVTNEEFWEKDANYRFSKIKNAFAIYYELLNYDKIKEARSRIKRNNIEIVDEITCRFFKTIRNLLLHFPVFDKWNEVWIKRSIINWGKSDWKEEGKSIDKFFCDYDNYEDPVKFRCSNNKNDEIIDVNINFTKDYKNNSKIYLKNVIPEKSGVKFSVIFMTSIINSQLR